MKIIKVINNNTVSVIDDKGKEQIISGKGIGFGKKYGDEPDKDKIQKMYLVTDSELRKRRQILWTIFLHISTDS